MKGQSFKNVNFPARFLYVSIPEVRHPIDLQLYIKYAPYIFLKCILLQLYTWKYIGIKLICYRSCRMHVPGGTDYVDL
jgi:hypothetical protein